MLSPSPHGTQALAAASVLLNAGRVEEGHRGLFEDAFSRIELTAEEVTRPGGPSCEDRCTETCRRESPEHDPCVDPSRARRTRRSGTAKPLEGWLTGPSSLPLVVAEGVVSSGRQQLSLVPQGSESNRSAPGPRPSNRSPRPLVSTLVGSLLGPLRHDRLEYGRHFPAALA